MAGPEKETWDKYQKLVLYKLDFLSENLSKLIEKQAVIEQDLAKMKAVASAFGVAGGILVTAVGWLIEYIQKH